jgi:hypothetical protein
MPNHRINSDASYVGAGYACCSASRQEKHMSDNLLAYIKGLFCFDAVVQRTDPARWNDQSPCERWTARGVVDHNVRVCFMIAEMARGHPVVVPEGSIERGRPTPSRDGFVFAPHLTQTVVLHDRKAVLGET